MVVAQEKYQQYSLPEEVVRVNRRPGRNRLPRKGKLTLTGLVLLTFCTGLIIAYYYSQVLWSGYRTYSLKKELETLRQDTVALEEEIDRLNSLDRIEYVATNKLKMVKPGSRDVVVVKGNSAVEGSGGGQAGTAGARGAEGKAVAQAVGQESGKNRVVQTFANLMGL
ncbi:MAG: septum formation initiator family protein [Bacillota bacterium]